VTVADLLSRHAPVPPRIDADDEPTQVISVDALLRREGHVPQPAERPAEPRGQRDRKAEPAKEQDGDRRKVARRGAVAAGTLLVAGSVVGATTLIDFTPTATTTPAPQGGDTHDGSYPGQGLLDQAPENVLPPPPDTAVIGPAAVADPLDPGTPAPSSWVPVAFPDAAAATPTATTAASADSDTADTPDTSGSSGSGANSSSGGSDSSGSSDDEDDNESRSSESRSSDSSDKDDKDSTKSSSSSDDDSKSNDNGDDGDKDRNDDEDDDGGLLDTVGDAVSNLAGTLLG
jgi:hypothetical protein